MSMGGHAACAFIWIQPCCSALRVWPEHGRDLLRHFQRIAVAIVSDVGAGSEPYLEAVLVEVVHGLPRELRVVGLGVEQA